MNHPVISAIFSTELIIATVFIYFNQLIIDEFSLKPFAEADSNTESGSAGDFFLLKKDIFFSLPLL